MASRFFRHGAAAALGAVMACAGGKALADNVILDDLIVTFSACIGNDCVNGESFGFDTLRLKENNTRISFIDTSTSGSFPTVDWEIQANESTNGGQNRFAVLDRDNSRTIFVLEAGAPSSSLYVDDGGRLGLGTSTPVVEVHVVDGDSPTLRLEQDGSSGFTAQTWDVAGNETNFFVRDVTGGSSLPFRIRAGAPGDALYIANDGDVGMGTDSPAAPMHVRRTNGTASMLVEDSGTSNPFLTMMELRNATAAGLGFRITDGPFSIDFNNTSEEFRINLVDGDGQELSLDADGNLTVDGTVTATGGATLPDYVFEADYPLRSLDELRAFIEVEGHLPGVPSADQSRTEDGRYSVEMISFQFALLEKIEELTLYTLAQEDAIRQLRAEADAADDRTDG